MSKTIAFLHGVDERNANYNQKMLNNLEKLKVGSEYVTLFYGDLLDPVESKLKVAIESSPNWLNLHFKPYRSLINQFIMDATQWFDTRQHSKIMQRIAQQMANVEQVDIFVFHSWGCVIGFDMFIATAACVNESRPIITMGCALQWANYWLQDLAHLNWTNYYHSMDLIGAPLNLAYGCIDHQVKDCGPPTEIVGPEGLLLAADAHRSYWESMTIAKHIAELCK